MELCTGVKFTDFGLKDFTPAELTDESPSAHVYWVFGQPPVASWNADTLVYIGENEHVIAAKITVRPDFTVPNNPVSSTIWARTRSDIHLI